MGGGVGVGVEEGVGVGAGIGVENYDSITILHIDSPFCHPIIGFMIATSLTRVTVYPFHVIIPKYANFIN